MATTIKWNDNNKIETAHRIYKSSTYFTKDNLPAPLVELGPDITEYVDSAGVDGENWYIVSALFNDYEVFSEPFIVGLINTLYIHDVFGDGSAVATYRLADGDLNDLGGGENAVNFDGTITQNGLLYSNSQEYSRLNTPILSTPISAVSMIVKADNFGGRSYNHIADFRLGSGSGYYTLNSTGDYNGSSVINFHLDGQPFDGALPYDQQYHHLYFELTIPSDGITFSNRHASSTTIGSINAEISQIRLFSEPRTLEQIDTLSEELQFYV